MLDNVRFGKISASAVSKALFLLLFLMLGVSAFAATVVVDDDGFGSAADCDDATPASSTIAAGVALALPGDTVRVCSGTYPFGATVSLNQAGLTLIGVGPTKPVVQVPASTGFAFSITASNVTLDNFEVQKTDLLGAPHELIFVNAPNFTAQNNLIYGIDPGSPWSVNGLVSRAFVVSGGSNGLLITNNVIHTLRQPAYIDAPTTGTISNNNVSGTRGWVIAGATITFTNNTFGPPSNQGADIALLSTCNPLDYPNLPALSAANDNAVISAQFGGGVSGASAVWVDDSAPAGGLGTIDAPLQTIQAGVNLVYPGGTVNVFPGTYIEDVSVTKQLVLNGSGPGVSVVSGAIGGGGATIQAGANGVEIRGFTITREGNNPTDWNGALNSAGISVQSVTGANIHDNLITGNRTGIDINNSNGNTVRNNVIDNNRTGLIFRNQTDNTTVVENFIANNWTVGVLFLDASGGTNSPVQTALSSAFANNSISGNWYGQVVDRQSGGSLPAPGTTNLKNFRGNWFGTATPSTSVLNSSEPGYAGQIPVVFGGAAVPPGGQPDILGTASANIITAPLLTNGTDTNVETTPGRGTYGFQGNNPVTPSAFGGWFFLNEGATGSGTFVAGPGTAPLGVGSAQLTVDSTGRHYLGTQAYAGTRLADVTRLTYQIYKQTNADPFIAPTLQFDVDSDLSDANTAFQGRLVFEPYLNGTVQQNTWQTWNALNGVWWGSAGGGTRPVTVACPQSSPCTTAQVLTLFPNVGVRFVGTGSPSNGVLMFRAGGPWAGGFTGSVDAFTIGINGADTTYDFDPVVPTVTINQAVAPQTDPTSTSPVNFTVTFSEPMTGFTNTDVSLGGTAGATTALVTGGPTVYNVAVSGMTSTGTVTATVPAGGAQATGSGASNAASTSTDNTVTYYTCNNISIATGQTTLRNAALTIPITTNSMTGQEVYSYDFTYTYNPTTLTYTGYSTTGTLSSGFTMTVHSPAAGVLVFSGFGATPLSGAGTLLNVNFTAAGPIGSTSNLTLSPFTLNEGVPCSNITNGDITIISGTVDGTVTYLNSNGNAPNPRVVAGVNLNAPGTPNVSGTTNGSGVYSLSGFGNSGYTVTPSKTAVAWNDPLNGISANDAARIAQHVVGVSTLTPNQQLAADVSNNGVITSFDSSIIARFVVNIPVPGVTGTWRFQPTDRMYTVPQLETGVAAQDYSAILMGDVTGNWNSTGLLWEDLSDFERDQAIEVGLPEMTAGSGSEIIVPVRAGDTTGKGVISYQFELRYDPQVLDAGKTPCIAAETLSSAMTVTCNAEEPGIVRVAVFGVADLIGKGELLRLKFNVTGEANSFTNLEFNGFKFNETFPFGVASNGRVTVTEAAAADTIGGRVLTPTGEAVTQARVTITDSNGNARTLTTNNFGNFRFAGLVNGETYTVTVTARGMTFTPRTVVVNPGAGQIDIVAEP